MWSLPTKKVWVTAHPRVEFPTLHTAVEPENAVELAPDLWYHIRCEHACGGVNMRLCIEARTNWPTFCIRHSHKSIFLKKKPKKKTFPFFFSFKPPCYSTLFDNASLVQVTARWRTQQTISWVNDGTFHWCKYTNIYASLGQNELMVAPHPVLSGSRFVVHYHGGKICVSTVTDARVWWQV